jgi:hypothetical protein
MTRLIGREICGVVPPWPFLSRTNTIKPMVRCNKVTTRVSHDRYVEVFESIDNILAETVLV